MRHRNPNKQRVPVLIILLLLLCASGYSQECVWKGFSINQLEGRVMYRDMVVPGAELVLHRAGDSKQLPILKTYSGSSGNFAFPKARPGKYVLSVRADGMMPLMFAFTFAKRNEKDVARGILIRLTITSNDNCAQPEPLEIREHDTANLPKARSAEPAEIPLGVQSTQGKLLAEQYKRLVKSATQDVVRGAFSENALVHLARERLLRSVVSVDSVVLLSDRTSPMTLDSFPNRVASTLAQAFNRENISAADVVGPHDVYAKIIPATFAGTANDTFDGYRQKDAAATAIIELSGTGITYRDGPGHHFKRGPNEIFGCARIVSNDQQTKTFCLHTTYNADTNVFSDELFELISDGSSSPAKWEKL